MARWIKYAGQLHHVFRRGEFVWTPKPRPQPEPEPHEEPEPEPAIEGGGP